MPSWPSFHLSTMQQLQQGWPDLLAISLKKKSFWVQSPSSQRPKVLELSGAVQQRGAQGLEAKGA